MDGCTLLMSERPVTLFFGSEKLLPSATDASDSIGMFQETNNRAAFVGRIEPRRLGRKIDAGVQM